MSPISICKAPGKVSPVVPRQWDEASTLSARALPVEMLARYTTAPKQRRVPSRRGLLPVYSFQHPQATLAPLGFSCREVRGRGVGGRGGADVALLSYRICAQSHLVPADHPQLCFLPMPSGTCPPRPQFSTCLLCTLHPPERCFSLQEKKQHSWPCRPPQGPTLSARRQAGRPRRCKLQLTMCI